MSPAPAATDSPASELELLRAKVRKLADEKSYLQLVIRLIEQINPLPGIDDMVRGLLYSMVETVGGTNIKLYYWIEDELHYADFAGERSILPAIDDPLVAKVLERREFLEQEVATADSLMQGATTPGVWTWIFPLVVGDALVGIVKIENLNCPAARLRDYLPTFLSHAALILSNEIRSHTRRKAEEALRRKTEELDTYFNTALDLFCIADLQGHFRKLNPSWQQALGYALPDLEGSSFIDLVHPDDRQVTMEALAALSARQPVLNFVNRYRHKDGTYRWIEWRALSNGELIFGAARDITERKQAEEEIREWNTVLEARVSQRTAELERTYEELKATQSQLLQQEKMASIGQLAAGVAHEINNPMGFIMSNLGTLRLYAGALREYVQGVDAALAEGGANLRARLDELLERLDLPFILNDLEPMLGESLDGAERVRAIVQNLKSFSHVDDTDMQQVNLNDCLESTVNIAWNELKYKASVVREYDSELPLVECWPQQINQVFLNLLLNAAQAIEDKGEIRLATRRDGDAVVVSIADSGRGIPPAIIGRIFEPFFTTRPVGQGTGLGLSLCYDIVKKHGGTIVVDSSPGQGTTFTIRLPIQIGPGMAADATSMPRAV